MWHIPFCSWATPMLFWFCACDPCFSEGWLFKLWFCSRPKLVPLHKFSLYFSIHSSLKSNKIPSPYNHHSMTQPPPYFTVAVVCLGLSVLAIKLGLLWPWILSPQCSWVARLLFGILQTCFQMIFLSKDFKYKSVLFSALDIVDWFIVTPFLR